ncbi:MAG: DUF3278 domain-containing protein [Enterococcus sp.]
MKRIEEKLIQHYVGYIGERDEYQKSKIYEILSSANMLTIYLSTILMFISLIWDSVHQKITLGTIFLLVVQQFNSLYLVFKLKKYQVQQTEFYDQASYLQAVKQIRRKTFLGGLNYCVWMWVMNVVVLPSLWQDEIHITWYKTTIWLITGIFFGITMYFFSKSQLRLVREESDPPGSSGFQE